MLGWKILSCAFLSIKGYIRFNLIIYKQFQSTLRVGNHAISTFLSSGPFFLSVPLIAFGKHSTLNQLPAVLRKQRKEEPTILSCFLPQSLKKMVYMSCRKFILCVTPRMPTGLHQESTWPCKSIVQYFQMHRTGMSKWLPDASSNPRSLSFEVCTHILICSLLATSTISIYIAVTLEPFHRKCFIWHHAKSMTQERLRLLLILLLSILLLGLYFLRAQLHIVWEIHAWYPASFFVLI